MSVPPGVTTRAAVTADVAPCVAIAEALPDYFTPDATREIAADLAADGGWVCEADGRVEGFAVTRQRWPGSSEIRWFAVAPDRRGTGVGTSLLDQMCLDLAAGGVRLLEVKTLDRSSGYEPYVSTCAFWERRGFVQVDLIDPLPGWAPGNPCAVYVATIGEAA